MLEGSGNLEGTRGCCVALSEAPAGLQLVDCKIFLNSKSSNCIFAPSHCYKFLFFLPPSYPPSFLPPFFLPSFLPLFLSLLFFWESSGKRSAAGTVPSCCIQGQACYLPPPDPDTLRTGFSEPLSLPFFWSCLPKPTGLKR